jgi:hypothetical protein
VTRRPFLVLAILTALLGAPSAVAAAPQNRLQHATASPASGSPSTLFALTVGYRSIAGSPARSVTATAGAFAVPLSLVAGTAVDGTWSGSVSLPVGTWAVRFSADAEQGNDPAVDGPTLTVLAPASPEVGPSDGEHGPQPSTEMVGPIDSPAAAPSPPAEAAPDASQPGDRGKGHQRADVPAATASPPGTTPTAGMPAVVAQPAATTPGESTMAHRDPVALLVASSGAMASPPLLVGEAADDVAEPPDAVATIVMVGLVGLAAVAMIGTGLLMAARRRRRGPETAVEIPLDGAVASDDDATIVLERRARRRARVRLPDDPIMTAMGITGETAPTPKPGPAHRSMRRQPPRNRRPKR